MTNKQTLQIIKASETIRLHMPEKKHTLEEIRDHYIHEVMPTPELKRSKTNQEILAKVLEVYKK